VDEADRVNHHHLHAVGHPEAPDRGIERREWPVRNLDASVGQEVHQRRLAGVGVADQRHRRKLSLGPPGALKRASALDFTQTALEPSEALANPPAVDLELGFAGSASADSAARGSAAGQARKMGPLAGQARLQIAQLRDLNLKLARQGACALGEDVQDKLASVDNPKVELFFEIARLGRTETVVKNRERRALLARYRP